MAAGGQGPTGPSFDGALRGVLALCVVAVLWAAAGCGPGADVEPGPESAPPRVAAAPLDPVRLEVAPGHALEHLIAPGETHEYLIELEPGEYFELEVEQRGVDVGLSLFDPLGELVLWMDLPIADLGREPLLGVAERTGGHRLQVKAAEGDDAPGSYRIIFSARRPAGDAERLKARAAKIFFRGEVLFWERRYQEALESYQQSLRLWEEAGDEFWQAEALDRIGTSHRRMGDWAQARVYHELAVEAFDRLGDVRFGAVSSSHLAIDLFELGEWDLAVHQYGRTLALQRQLGDRRGEGMSLGALANIYKVKGESQKALDNFKDALALLDRPEDARYRATPLHNLGTLYRRLGKPDRAEKYLRQAERTYAQLGDLRRQASSLSQLGQLAFEAGESGRALRLLRHSLELRRQRRDRRGEAAALRNIGTVLLAEDDVEGARLHYLQALELLSGLESARSEAAVLSDLGELHNRLGRSIEGVDYHRRALAIYRRIGDPVGEAEGLLGIAVSERGQGRIEAALAAGDRALEIVETLRLKPLSEELRFSFFSTVQRFFDVNIDLLMELERLDPRAGHGARALQVSERARARSLLDLLSEAGAEIRDDTAPELLEEERELQQRLNQTVEVMEAETSSEAQRAAAAATVQRLLEQLDTVRTAVRRHSPRYAALTQPRPLGAEEIQRQVLDRETVLLQYRLGSERSFLWLVTRDELTSFELAPAAEIEGNVRKVHALFQGGGQRETEGRTRDLLCSLSEQLLRPVAGRLSDRRLAIVADGALEYLPFAALPDPDSAEGCLAREPLIVAHEIVHLPSVSTLAVLRREAQSRDAPAGTIAVLADPVFSADDDRITGRTPSTAPPGEALLASRAEEVGQGSYRRLRHSRDEAEAILDLVPPAKAFRALDFDASKQVVESGLLAGYRVLHFATHGHLRAEQPALSGVVLSLFDRRGQPIEGFLRSHEIYNLRLPAELVVLGGCETALGKEVRGEGLVGLTRGFMYAGASRVMVSLWKVSDRGTADLMESFYRNLMEEGLAPAAALRQAQLEMRSARPQPFHWAGFIVQGDWRSADLGD